MEGEQYQIRTMARDVEEAERAAKPPVFREISLKTLERIPKQLTDKTAEVRGQDFREERKLEEILHEARRRIEVPPIRQAQGRPIGPTKMLEDILPIEEKAVKPMAEAISPVPPRTGETPEEILGLPQRLLEPPRVSPRSLPVPAKPEPVPSRQVLSLKVPERLRGLRTLKFALFTTFLSIALIVTAFGVFKIFSGQEPPPLPESPLPKIIEQSLPQALIRYDEVKSIEISELSYDAVKSAIDALQDVDFPAGSLAYIPIKYSSAKEIRYLTAAEFFEVLQIDLPPLLAASESFTLFLSIQGESARLGFILALPQGEAAGVMKEWEKTIVDDLRPLIFGMAKREEGAVFRLGSYKSFETHFINLPIPTTSVDWILADGNLVVATSKDAARAALDRLPSP